MNSKPSDVYSSPFRRSNFGDILIKPSVRKERQQPASSPLEVPEGPFTDVIEYWRGLSSEGEIPGTESFDLLSIPILVESLTIFEVSDQRIHIRFVGAKIVDEIGEDTTGQYLDEMPNMSAVEERAFNCIETGLPYFHSDLPVTWTSKDFKTYSTLGLPLVGENGRISQIVFLMIFN